MTISFTQYSLYWIQHVAMLLVPFLLNAQVFLFWGWSKSLFFFAYYAKRLNLFAPSSFNPIVLLYTGPALHPATKKLSAMACSLLLHLFPLPHPSSSTCGLGSSCQPGLCALSGSEVGERFVFLIVFGTCNILSLVDEMVFMNNSEKCLFVSCVQYLFCTFIYLDTSSDPFYGPHYLLHHVWSQVWNDFTISMILK